jgi:hypothetical protein
MIKSILVWPKHINLGWHESVENKSEDTHHSEYAAKAVCQTLIREGFGCDGEDYPVEARVEVDGVVKFRYTKEGGYLIDDIKQVERYSRGWHPDRCY